MEEERLERMIREREGSFSVAFPRLMRKVYLWMTLAMVITGITAYGVATSPALINMFFQNSVSVIILFVAQIGLVIALSAAINRLSLTTATLLFILYSVLTGVTFSSIFLVYTMSSISSVFFITAGMFAAMSLIGHFTKSNLSGMGTFLFMALVGLIIATFVNVFLHSSGLALILNYAGVIIFAGLTAFDTQRIKQMLIMCDDMDESAHKIALLGSLTLYLDFINMFIYLLRLFGNRE